MSANPVMPTAGSSGIKLRTRMQLFNIMQEKEGNINSQLGYLENFLLQNLCAKIILFSFSVQILHYCHRLLWVLDNLRKKCFKQKKNSIQTSTNFNI